MFFPILFDGEFEVYFFFVVGTKHLEIFEENSFWKLRAENKKLISLKIILSQILQDSFKKFMSVTFIYIFYLILNFLQTSFIFGSIRKRLTQAFDNFWDS